MMADNWDHLTAISSFLLDSPNTQSSFSENFATVDGLLPFDISDDHVASFDNDSSLVVQVTKDKEGEETVVGVDSHVSLSPSTYDHQLM